MSAHLPTPVFRQGTALWPRLSILTVLVLLAHGSLLMSAPVFLSAASAAMPMPVGPAFTTRTIDIPPAAALPAVPEAAPPVITQTPVERPAQAAPTAPSLAMPALIEPISEAAYAEMVRRANAPETRAIVDTEAAAPAPPDPPLQLAATTVAVPNTPATSASSTPPPYALPPSANLSYDVKCEIKGFPCSMQGELQWQHDGKTYNARLEFKHFLLGSRAQTSTGQITAQGLEPLRFGDKTRSEVAAHFERKKGKISYSANTPDEVLQPGAQDQLSVFMQLASMLGASPQSYPAGTQLSFQAVGPRSSEIWVFVVGNTEKLVLPGGTVSAIQLSRAAVNENDSHAELWLAPTLGYLPVRIRLDQANGDFVDQRWNGTPQ